MVCVARDPRDVHTIGMLALGGLVLTGAFSVSVLLNLWQFWRVPDRIVVDRTSGRVIEINDRQYGMTDAVQMEPDALRDDDKRYLAGEFARGLHAIDPTTRTKDLERTLKLMAPATAMEYVRHVREQGTLRAQKDESWQATWTLQDVQIDASDPFVVRIIGRQELTRIVDGGAVKESHQYSLQLKLVADPRGRADRNLRSGFLVASFETKEI